MKRILVCEDEDSIREFVVINLNRAGYTVAEAVTGEEAAALFEASLKMDPADGEAGFDMALLDVMLPGIDGFEVCRRIREKSDAVGIIMLTALSQEAEKVNGLAMGADDYITKPFSPSELIARVDALYRRVTAARTRKKTDYTEELVSGDFVLNLRSRSMKKKGKPIELTQMEFQVMEYFFTHPGRALSRTDILNRIWGAEYFGEEKIVDVNIRRLRMKIEENASEPKYIVTVWGLGYKWTT